MLRRSIAAALLGGIALAGCSSPEASSSRAAAPGRSFDLTAAQASPELGYDVQTLGQDPQKLTAYVDALDD